jgi:hypothetical protein
VQTQVANLVMQVKKEAKELERQFGTGTQIRLPGKIAAMVRDINGTEVEMATIMIFGDSQKCEQARSLLLEAVDNKEQKQKQRQKVCPYPGSFLPCNKEACVLRRQATISVDGCVAGAGV